MLPIDPPLRKAKPQGTITGPWVTTDLNDDIADLVDDMFDAEGKEQARLARKVLERDHENIDALTVLSDHAGSKAETLVFLREAVRIGNRVWKEALESDTRVDWWDLAETRPFMRAIMAYGEALADHGQPDQAALCFKALLDMQPDDSLGAQGELDKLTAPGPGRRR